MPSFYEAVTEAPLQQCELLAGLVENRAVAPAHYQKGAIEVQPFKMPLMMVLTNGCDLLFDHEERGTIPQETRSANPDWEQDYHRITPHVLLCQVFSESEIKGLHNDLVKKKLDRVKKNQEERLHHLPVSAIRGSIQRIDAIFLDFKKTYSLPTQAVYDAIATGDITRRAVLVEDRRYDLTHRFYSYLGRVGVPDDE